MDGERAGPQAFGFQGQAAAFAVHIFHNRDGRHPMFRQPPVHGFEELIGVWLFRAGIRKGNQVHGNPMLVKPD